MIDDVARERARVEVVTAAHRRADDEAQLLALVKGGNVVLCVGRCHRQQRHEDQNGQMSQPKVHECTAFRSSFSEKPGLLTWIRLPFALCISSAISFTSG